MIAETKILDCTNSTISMYLTKQTWYTVAERSNDQKAISWLYNALQGNNNNLFTFTPSSGAQVGHCAGVVCVTSWESFMWREQGGQIWKISLWPTSYGTWLRDKFPEHLNQ